MFDISTVNRRYFEIKIKVSLEETVKDEIVNVEKEVDLEVKPPKLKALKKISSLSENREEEAIGNLSQALKMILCNNRTNYVVSDEIIDELDLDEMNGILTEYFKWLAKEKNSKN